MTQHMNNLDYRRGYLLQYLPNFVKFWRAFTLQIIAFQTFLNIPSEGNFKGIKINSIDNFYYFLFQMLVVYRIYQKEQ